MMVSRLKYWIREIKTNKNLIFISFIILIFASIFNILAGNYVDKIGTVAASDIILDNIPSLNLNFFYIYGYFAILGIFFFFIPYFLM